MTVLRSLLLCAAIVTCCAGSAFAVDGVVLIDQNRALAGGVTPNDSPGFPVIITQPGSYRLSGNLTVPAPATGILVMSNDVTIDLNGFRMTGEGSGRGITDEGTDRQNVVIRNGSLSGFLEPIFMSGDRVQVHDVRTTGGQRGINLMGEGAIVTGSHVTNALWSGIAVFTKAIVRNNIASNNGLEGVFAGQASLVSGNNAVSNGSGIRVICPGALIGNVAIHNDSNIDPIGAGCTMANNTPTP